MRLLKSKLADYRPADDGGEVSGRYDVKSVDKFGYGDWSLRIYEPDITMGSVGVFETCTGSSSTGQLVD